MPNPHHLSPMEGSCHDCGATREQIQDNLFPVCEKVTGPHRLAILAIQYVERAKRRYAESLERDLETAPADGEDGTVAVWKEAWKIREEVRDLHASAEFLKGLAGDKPPPLAEAIGRL